MAEIKQIKINSGFKPVAIQITFETQDELDLFGSLFNSTFMTRKMEKAGISHDFIRGLYGLCDKLGGNIHFVDKFIE